MREWRGSTTVDSAPPDVESFDLPLRDALRDFQAPLRPDRCHPGPGSSSRAPSTPKMFTVAKSLSFDILGDVADAMNCAQTQGVDPRAVSGDLPRGSSRPQCGHCPLSGVLNRFAEKIGGGAEKGFQVRLSPVKSSFPRGDSPRPVRSGLVVAVGGAKGGAPSPIHRTLTAKRCAPLMRDNSHIAALSFRGAGLLKLREGTPWVWAQQWGAEHKARSPPAPAG